MFKPNGNYTFKPGEDFQALEPGQSEEVSFTYVAVDNNGAKSEPQTITITVTGTNDAPVAEAKTDSVIEDTVITGVVSASDVDLGDDAELSFSTDSTAEGLTFNADGSYTFDASSYDSLGKGEKLVLEIPVTVTDEHDAAAQTTLTITVTGTNDAPVATDFSVEVTDEQPIQVSFDGVGSDHISDIEDDRSNSDGKVVGVVITELPIGGTLFYTQNGITREISEDDLHRTDEQGNIIAAGTIFESDSISYKASNDSQGFVLGAKEGDQLDDQSLSQNDFYNWGEAQSGTVRTVTFENGDQVTISSNKGALTQYRGDAGHIGHGLGIGAGAGINQGETLTINFDSRPASSIHLGLDGLGGYFSSAVDNGNSSFVTLQVTLSDGRVVDYPFDHPNGFQKDEKGNSDLFHELEISTDAIPGADGLLITGITVGTHGNGNWELRYIETSLEDSIDYKAVDSDGTYSEESSVTFDDGRSNTSPNANNDATANGSAAFEFDHDEPVIVPLADILANDSDLDGDSLRITYVFGETVGDARIENGNVIFDLPEGFSGDAEFQYQITDDKGGFDTAMVKVLVNPAPTQPDIGSVTLDTESVIEGESLVYSVNLGEVALIDSVYSINFGAGGDTAQRNDIDPANMTFSNGVRYNESTGQLEVPAGISEFDVILPTVDDFDLEDAESFTLQIDQASSAQASILDNDNQPPKIDLNGDGHEVVFESESAGYSNVFGYFFVDSEGNPSEPTVLIHNTNSELANGDVIANLESIEGAEFFLIANGASQTPGNALLSFNDQGQLLVNGNAPSKPVYLSTDQSEQYKFVVTNDDSGVTEIHIEDILLQQSDKDYNDLVVTIRPDSSDNGTGYTASFTEHQAPVSVVDNDVSISDDRNTISYAEVILKNTELGDVLTVDGETHGDLMSGIVFTSETQPSGSILITFTGEASTADYEAAMAKLLFSNTSHTPNEDDRIIEITVYDENSQPSNTAVSTISVSDVADFAIAAAQGDEDTKITLDISLLSDGGVEQVSLVNIPDGAKIFDGDNELTVINNAITLSPSELENLSIQPPANSDDDFILGVSGLDSSGTAFEQHDLAVTVKPVTDIPTLSISGAEILASIDFENVQLGGSAWRGNVTETELNNNGSVGIWGTLNSSEANEVGNEGVYRNAEAGEQGNNIYELEGRRGTDNSLFTQFTARAGAFYSISFDIAARAVGTSPMTLFLVNEAGERTELFVYDENSTWTSNEIKFETPLEGDYKLVFESNQTDSYGALLDNVSLLVVDNYGYEDSPIHLSDFSASLTDTDGSESLAILLKALPEGAVVSNGAASLTVGSDGIADISGWGNLNNLQVTIDEPGQYPVTIEVTASETDAQYTVPNSTVSEVINVTVLEKAADPVEPENSAPTVEDFVVISDDEDDGIKIDFSDHAQDMEDDASSSDDKETSVLIVEDAKFGQLYYVDENGKDVKVEVGSVITDTTELKYDVDDVVTGFDTSGDDFEWEPEKLTEQGITLSGGTFKDDVHNMDNLSSCPIDFNDTNGDKRGIGVNSEGRNGNSDEVDSEKNEYISVKFDNSLSVTEASVSLGNLTAHFNGKNATGQVHIHLYKDGEHQETVVVDKNSAIEHHQYTAELELDSGFDEIRITASSTKEHKVDFVLQGVEVEEASIRDSIVYKAQDSNGNFSETAVVDIIVNDAEERVQTADGVDSISLDTSGQLFIQSAEIHSSPGRNDIENVELDDNLSIHSGDSNDYVELGISSGDNIVNTGSSEPNTPADIGRDFFEDAAFMSGEILDADGILKTTVVDEMQPETDTVNMGSGDDVVISDGGNLAAFGGAGDDILYGSDTGSDGLRGGEGNDVLRGRGGDDYLVGDEGEDVLSGGIGSDILTGGEGADLFAWDSTDLDGNTDTISDFSIEQGDKIDLSDLFEDVESSADDIIEQYVAVSEKGDHAELNISKGSDTVSIELEGVTADTVRSNLADMLIIKDDI
ncbi:Ig-like domain-containing protein [Vibrio sp. ZSDZ34]|uniref:Ig-like domain-containing protein n=1 Tax=Vibrio gelatinilyticus TaxID=2893468 RepID=A0A9X1WDN6_9VIBR|nr:Ig-like domain-containing protein [Vibrio gelatinilyticus]